MDIELQDLKSNLIEKKEDKKNELNPSDNTKNEPPQKILTFERTVHLTGAKTGTNPKNTNKMNNRKYTVLYFVPKVLYDQFKYFFNLFFLLLCISQFIPMFKVGLLFSYVAPLVFVLTLTLLKEGYDDYKRYVRDKETNEQIYNVWTPKGFIEKRAEDLVEGNIIELHAYTRIPTDCVLLWTSDPSGTVFIKTDQLDGETDWKLRNPIHYTQKKLSQNLDLSGLSGYIGYEGPHKEIYNFNGLFINEMNRSMDESLNLDNTLWCSTVLCSSKALAIIIFSGKETRIAMNISEGRKKMGRLDSELNQLSKLLFFIMTGVSIFLISASTGYDHILSSFVKYILLLSSIIPVSLRVNLDFSKIFFTYKINQDTEIEAIARNSDIPEELGRVGIILSDKTGTLTKNEMQFKQISSEYYNFSSDDTRTIKLLNKELRNSLTHDNTMSKSLISKSRFSKGKIIKEFLLSLAVCHNVTPVIEEGVKSLQASSPDEIALVKAAEQYGLILHERNQKKMTLYWEFTKTYQNYEILYNFPFTSDRKRMGIIVRQIETNKIIFYLKGADFVMKDKVPEVKRGYLMDECDNLSRLGLRTLVFAFKILSEEELKKWAELYDEANKSVGEREKKQNAVVDMLEKNVQFLAITGVEDKLQDNCASTIESLKSAGIKIWMLTGDKVETVSCVAISTGLKGKEQDFFILKDIKNPEVLTKELNRFANLGGKAVFVVDGLTLDTAFKHNEEFFFKLASDAIAVICCRVSPTQKAEVVLALKKYSNKLTLAIGDGGNDVPMIMAADVGVGIVGKEGKQAALASDFSLNQFKNLKELLFWHGRNSYRRGAVMAQFVIHRGLIISIMQIYFLCIFGFIQVPLFNGFLMLGYSTLYTMLPVFALIFDNDVDRHTALRYAILYSNLQKERELTTKTFFIWLWKSIYQAFIIVFLNLLLFDDPYRDFISTCFSTLIFVQFLNSFAETHTYNIVAMVSIGVSLLLYLFTFLFLRDYFGLSTLSFYFFFKCFIVASVCYVPIYIVRRLINRFAPTEEFKIMTKSKIKQKGKIRKFFEKIFCRKKQKISNFDLNN
jgi:phospholipid-translocating ATPase